MPRPPRADKAGGLYHALNRGNLRADIFKKEGDFVAFEKILFEGLQLHQVELFSYQLMSNHYHGAAAIGRWRNESIYGVESIALRLNLESTMRPRGRRPVRPALDDANKEA